MNEGQTTIVARDDLVPGYILVSPRSVVVSVDQNGTAAPARVQFRYKEAAVPTPTPTPVPTPTPTPVPTPTPTPEPTPTATPEPLSVTVTVHYIRQDTNGIIGGEQHILTEGQHLITSNDSGLAGFVRQGEGTVTVTVSGDGTAAPNPVIFYYLPESSPPREPTAEPTPEPTPSPPRSPLGPRSRPRTH